MTAFLIIDLDKLIEEKIQNKDDVMPLPDSVLLKKGGAEVVNELFKQFAIHKKGFNKTQIYEQINLLINARHKIIHNNIDIAITQEDVYIMTAALYEFIILLDRILQDIKKVNESARE